MESKQIATSYKAAIPLFPAYTSTTQNEEGKEDWLCNSSFTESAFKQVCIQLSNTQKVETSYDSAAAAESTPVEIEKLSVEIGRKKSLKRKRQEKYTDPLSFSVPDSESIRYQLRKKTFIGETGLSVERAFQTDNTRDPDNLMFECFERTKIASYHSSLKVPVGLSSKELLSWFRDLPKKKVKRSPRYFSRKFSKSIKSADSEVIYMSKEPLQTACLNYIPITILSNDVMHPEKIESSPNFLNVSSSWKSGNIDKEKVTCDKMPNESLDTEMRNKIIYYNKNLSEDHGNIEMWIDFVDFQEELFMSEKIRGHIYSNSNVAEKKIAILEKALKYNPKDVRLNTMKLKLSQDLYSSDKVISMWDELIFFYPNNAQVWQEYLLYIISSLETFNISSILKLYGKCLRTLSDVSEGITESHEPCPDIVPSMLGIFNQFCCILKSCDYTEKAIATYQALIEFNLFCESSIEVFEVKERISYLEPFWDSGAHRVGECNAIGWAATVQQKKILFDHLSTDSDLNNMEDEILNKKLTLSETWLEFERLRAAHHWLPWRPNPEYDQTNDDIDDVDRTVSFDDVSKFLFHIPDEEHKFLLVMHFIKFLGFDVHLLGCHNMGNKTVNKSLCIDDYENILRQINKSQLIKKSINPFSFDIHFWTEERYNFINNIFSQVIDKFSPKYKTLCTYMWIKFKKYYFLEIKSGKENMINLKKFVKSILKKNENRNCLLLWFEYICIEWIIDKSNAIKTFQALLLSSTSAVSVGNMQLQELWYFAQAFIELSMNNLESFSSESISSNELLWMLIQIINKEKYVPYSNQELKPTVILKTISSLKSALEKELRLLSIMQSKLCYCIDPYNYSVINCAKSVAYFQYFSQSCDAAMQVYENVTSFINTEMSGCSGKYISEQINVAQAKLLNYHTWNSSTSIKPLQAFLCNSVTNYPHNSQLLYLLVKLRSASSVISPTRRFLAQILKNHHRSHPVTWFFTLIAEFAVCCSLLSQNDVDKDSQREIISSLSINWRIRSLFERMLQSDMCAHLPILWKSYLKFEIMTQNIEKAKSVFHRALQNCGWSKELLMDAIEYFPEELNEILAFMTEKQLRIHTPLEEVTLLKEHVVTDS